MKSRIKHKEECTKIFLIEVPHETVRKTAEEVYREIKRIAKVPGFRAGSVPQDLLEKHYFKDAKEEILKRLIPGGYKEALTNHKVTPASLPRFYNIDFEIGKALTFEAEVETKPHIKLRNYKGMKVKKRRISVSSEHRCDTNITGSHHIPFRPITDHQRL